MSTLVKRRAEIIEHGGAEKKHGAAGGGVDSTMLEMERQHKAKILEATKRRMYEEQQRNLAEEAKKEQMIEDEKTKKIEEDTIVDRMAFNLMSTWRFAPAGCISRIIQCLSQVCRQPSRQILCWQ